MRGRRRCFFALWILVMAAALCPPVQAGRPTVTIWAAAGNGFAEAELTKRQAEIERKYKVDLFVLEMNPGGLTTELAKKKFENRGLPDIIDLNADWNYNGLLWSAKPDKSVLIPLTGWAKRSRHVREISPWRLSYLTLGRDLYGLPYDVSPAVFIYCDPVWRAAGVDLARVNTWDEYVAKCRPLCADRNGDGKPDRYAFLDSWGLDPYLDLILQQAGAQFYDEKGKPALTSPAFTGVITSWLRWVRESPSIEAKTADLLAEALRTGRLLALPVSDSFLRYLTGSWENAHPGEDSGLRVMPLPAWQAGGRRTGFLGGNFRGVTRGAKNPKLCYEIIEWLSYSPDAMRRRYSESGLLPPIAGLYKDPLFHKPIPALGGQRAGELMLRLLSRMPAVNAGDRLYNLRSGVANNVWRARLGQMTVVEAMLKAMEEADAVFVR